MTTALWPEFKVEEKPTGVVRVLEGAGEELGRKTGGRVVFRVLQQLAGGTPSWPFRYECDLWVPKLQYRYFLCDVFASAEGFPVRVTSGEIDRPDIADEAALQAALAELFHADQVRKIVQNLLSMTV